MFSFEVVLRSIGVDETERVWRWQRICIFDNLTTGKLRLVAHGPRNFEHDRLRLSLHSGARWNTLPTVWIRGRHPRLVAESS
jgi:hypothetical protein